MKIFLGFKFNLVLFNNPVKITSPNQSDIFCKNYLFYYRFLLSTLRYACVSSRNDKAIVGSE